MSNNDNGLAGITDGIRRRVQDAVPMLGRVAGEQPGRHRKAVMELFRCLESGWVPGPSRNTWLRARDALTELSARVGDQADALHSG